MAHILHRAKLTSISSNANAVAKFYTTSDEAYISLTANNCNDYSYNDYNNAGIFGSKLYSNTHESFIGSINNQIKTKLATFNYDSITLNTNAYIHGNILPVSDSLYDIGSIQHRWCNLHLSGGINGITCNELGYLSGITSDIQQQINGLRYMISNIDSNFVTLRPLTYFPTSDQIVNGSSNKFIVSNVYADDLHISGTLTASNLNVIGTTTTIDTNTYTTNDLEIIAVNEVALKIVQNGTQDIAQFFDANEKGLIVKGNGYVGIGTTIPRQKLDVSGNFKIAGIIIPSSNLQYDIGTTSNKWRELYLAGNTIYLDDTRISIDSESALTIKNSYNQLVDITVSSVKIKEGRAYSEIKNINDKLSFISYDTYGIKISEASLYSFNSNISNYVSSTIPALNSSLTLLDTNISNYLSAKITNLDLHHVSNYVDTLATNIYGALATLDFGVTESNISNYLSAIVYDNNNISNYFYNIVSNLYIDIESILMIDNMSNYIHTIASDTNSFALFDSKMSNFVSNTFASIKVPTLDINIPISSNIIETNISNCSIGINFLNSNISNYIDNISNSLYSRVLNASNHVSLMMTTLDNNLSNYILTLSADQIANGKSQECIINGVYSSNLIIDGTLTASNINIIGNTMYVNTLSFQTENVEIISQAYSPAFKVVQNGTQKIAQFYDGPVNVVVIDENGVGIGNTVPQQKLDVTGSINFTESINGVNSNILAYMSGVNAPIQFQIVNNSNIISRRVSTMVSNLAITSNVISNRISTLNSNISNYISTTFSGTSQSSQWTISGNNIYYSTGNVGIGTSLVQNSLEIYGGDMNIATGKLKRTMLYSNTPVVWYQFNQTPALFGVLNDSNSVSGGTKYNLNIKTKFFYDTNNLIAWYQFEGTNTYLNNSFGGGSSWTASLVTYDITNKAVGNGAVNFSSSASTGGSTLTATGINIRPSGVNASFSISLWVRLTMSTASTVYRIFAVGTSTTHAVNLTWNTTRFRIILNSGASGFDVLSFTTSYAADIQNKWFHFVYVYNVSLNTSYCYVNGVYKAGITGVVPNGGNGNMHIGSGILTSLGFTGQIDDVRIYTRDLTATEAAALYSASILSKTTGYTLSSYSYTNAYFWNGNTTTSSDNVYLSYDDNVSNIQNLLNTFHTNCGFSIHFVFTTANITSTTQILYIGNTAAGDLIRIFIVNATFIFKVGSATATTTIAANTYYVTDVVFSYVADSNMTLKIYLNNVDVSTTSVTYANILFLVNTVGLVYNIGGYTDTNDASPLSLQDFRIFATALSVNAINSLQTGSVSNGSTNITNNYQLERWVDSPNYYFGTKFIRYTDGNVGIGTNLPTTKLHVGSAGYTTGNVGVRYFDVNTAMTSIIAPFSDICSTFDSSIWVKSTIASSSDERIKKNINDIIDDSALQKIMAIEPKTYNYIDSARGTNQVYGFLAQQIREVIPEAVRTQRDLIPNIFSVANCSANTISFNSNITINDSLIDAKMIIIDLYGCRDTYQVTGVDIENNTVTIDKNIADGKVFVYGTEVQDFHILDKSYIYTLNVCATQVLCNKINYLYNGIQQMIERIDLLEQSKSN